MSENLIGQIITGVVTLALALIGYFKLKIGQDKIAVKVDGMTSKLVDAEKGKSNAEGQLTGMAQEKQSAIDAAKVVVVPGVQEVKIVEQAKPIDVKIDKGKI